MCGIMGLALVDEGAQVAQALVDGLMILQHRGQDAAGIVTYNKGRLNMRKNPGPVSEVFTSANMPLLLGNMGIGHVRYPTAGGGSSSCSSEAQPLYTNAPLGIALAHNGNLTNTDALLVSLRDEHRHVNTDSDSEMLLNVYASELQRALGKTSALPSKTELFAAVRAVMLRCTGAYAVILLVNGAGLVAFRDPHGIRPLCFGARSTALGSDFCIASESVAVDALDPTFRLVRDVQPGEAVFVSCRGEFFSQMCHDAPVLYPCLFEYVYFARPDSIMDGVTVYDARLNMGAKLAKLIRRDISVFDIDVVIPIPDTSRTSALQCAYSLDRPYREGFVKNRYIARTFIMPGQEKRKKTVRLKLNTIRSEFKDKVVLLVDDSIVRGTTSLELVQMAREAGAKKVYFASAAPAVRFPNVYGIDIPSAEELIANNRSTAQIAMLLKADAVFYNELADLEDAVRSLNPTVLTKFDASCFDGRYVTAEVTADYLLELEGRRGKGRKDAVASKGTGKHERISSPHPEQDAGIEIIVNEDIDARQR